MVLLITLWMTAAVLIACSLMAATAVIAGRLVARWRRARLERSRRAFVAQLLRRDGDPTTLRRHVARAARHGALAHIVLRVQSTVRGRTWRRFVDRLRDAGAETRLIAVLERGSSMNRRRAAEALAAPGGDDVIWRLRLFWRDRDPSVRAAVLTGSIDLGDPPSFEFVLSNLLSSGRRRAAQAQGVLRRLSQARPREAVDWLERVELSAGAAVPMLEGASHASNDIVMSEALRRLAARNRAVFALAAP
ncbi:MAG: hypothetical protein A4S17_11105 [Proteobacteria bacterium HN_bin10]|nr:MAG: hypothetical protein A4S17_11105 [Proteobacteria bacterium HN_bin10]